jgi:hypothetical protein
MGGLVAGMVPRDRPGLPILASAGTEKTEWRASPTNSGVLRSEENVLIRVTEEAKALLSTVDLGALDSAEGTVLRLDPVAYDEETGEVTLGFAPGEGKGNDQIVQHGGQAGLAHRRSGEPAAERKHHGIGAGLSGKLPPAPL